MNILIACEYSGVVRDSFASLGHRAVSCDLLPTERPGFHAQDDVRKLLGQGWDMMIAFPPCTYLCVSGSRWWSQRQQEQREAIDFFLQLYNCTIPKIAIENPVGIISTVFRKPDQYIQPWQFGHGETKKTGLWLKNLPLLVSTDVVEGREPRVHTLSPSKDRWKLRSTTLQGIASAMATQWT